MALLSRAPQVVDHAVVSSAILRPLWVNRMVTPGLVGLSYRWFMAPFKNNDWWIRLNMRGAAGITEEYFADFKRGFQETTYRPSPFRANSATQSSLCSCAASVRPWAESAPRTW